MTLREILGNPISREEALELIKSSEEAYETFLNFPEKYREEILEFMQGN